MSPKVSRVEKNLFSMCCFPGNYLALLLSGFLPKVVGREKPHNPGHSPQTCRFWAARVHVWNVIVLIPFDLGFRFFFKIFLWIFFFQKWWVVYA